MTDNRNEKRNARRIQQELTLPYVMALRLLREGTVMIRDGVVIDRREVHIDER